MKTDKIRKFLLSNIPYLFIGWAILKISTAYRISFVELYSGRDDIPDEHRVFSMPRLSIREQMAAFKEVIDRSSMEGERKLPKPGREDR
mgnify:CR=1 FL=1